MMTPYQYLIVMKIYMFDVPSNHCTSSYQTLGHIFDHQTETM